MKRSGRTVAIGLVVAVCALMASGPLQSVSFLASVILLTVGLCVFTVTLAVAWEPPFGGGPAACPRQSR